MEETQLKINEKQAALLLRLMDEQDPEFDYRELAELSIVRSDLNDFLGKDTTG